MMPVFPVLAQAVEDALAPFGVRFDRVPVTRRLRAPELAPTLDLAVARFRKAHALEIAKALLVSESLAQDTRAV